jgi:mono/diheme cytochrome c family protein
MTCLGAARLLALPAEALDARERRGFTLAKANCAKCHAIGNAGESPLRGAPAFRTLHQRYPVEDLAESLQKESAPDIRQWRNGTSIPERSVTA